MYDYISGTLTHSTPLFATVEVGGIGYLLQIPPSVFSEIPPSGEKVKLYTSFVVRELSQTLYGFLTRSDRDLFESLTTISGVGPKLALSLIGHLPGGKLHECVMRGDPLALTKVPGVGKKTATRLIMELKDKIGAHSLATFTISMEKKLPNTATDALSALIQLGYPESIAEKAVQKSLAALPQGADLSLVIKESLNFC